MTSRAWSGGGSPGTGTGGTFTTSYASAGTKTITLKACNGTACNTKTQNITVTAPPIGTYVVATEDVAFYPDETVQVSIFVDTPAGGLGYYDIDLIYDPDIIKPIGCTDWYGGDCDTAFFFDTINFYGTANATGNLVIGSVTFEAVDGGLSDLIIEVFDMESRTGVDVTSNVVEVDGSAIVQLYIF